MKTCTDPCPVDGLKRCCFECDKRPTCNDSCVFDSMCADAKEEEYIPAMVEKQAEPIMELLRDLVVKKNALEKQEKELKEKLKKLMEDTESKSFKNNPFLNITYVAATVSTSIDSAMVKKKYPSVYAECSKQSPKSSYIKVEVKE